jgi:hypothetical protein
MGLYTVKTDSCDLTELAYGVPAGDWYDLIAVWFSAF